MASDWRSKPQFVRVERLLGEAQGRAIVLPDRAFLEQHGALGFECGAREAQVGERLVFAG